jgi:transcriptional regulator with XRE-family HTH domain
MRKHSGNGPKPGEVRALRLEKRISQEGLAGDLGIVQEHYSKIERGVVPDRNGYLKRAYALLTGRAGGDAAVDDLVKAAAKRIRLSPAFRKLVEAALQMPD